jgi:hypothetical protein
MILAPEFAPTTGSLGLLEAPLDDVAKQLHAWYGEVDQSRSLKPIESSFPDALRRVQPLNAPFFIRLWIATTGARWHTAYFDGFINGSDPFPPISYLAQRIGCFGLVISDQPESEQSYAARRIELYGPNATEWLNLEWGVSVVNDGGPWVWDHFGPTQPFEEPENYTKRRIRDRFTPDMLRRYCAALDVPMSETQFGPRCVLDVPAELGA